jgi:lysyl endopeptidase
MFVKLKPGLICLAATVLAACGGGSDAPNAETSSASVAGETLVVRSATGDTRTVALSTDAYTPSPASTPFAKAAKPIVALQPAATLIDIGAPSQSKVSILAQRQEDRPIGVPLQVAFARPVQATSDDASTAKLLAWTTTAAGGKVAALELKSLTATGMRIGLLVKSLPAQAMLRFYTPDANKVTEVSGQDINKIIQTNLDAGDTSSNARTYWGPTLKDERGIVEIELPASVDPAQLEISIPNISHAFIEPFTKTLSSSSIGDQAKGIGDSAACQVNVSCETPLPPVSNAIAYMDYIDNGAGYECTGTLLNDTASSGIPYFLTANHCISTQAAASSLYTTWFAKSTACNTSTLSVNAVLLTTGATLLYSKSATSGVNGVGPVGTDTSFLRLNSQPPAGAMYAGWTAATQAISSNPYATLHHPRGDVQKISKGTINSYGYTSGLSATGGFSVTTNTTKNLFPLYRVSWSSGVTEGGSSGGGLFAGYASTNPQIVGQLLGGSSSCAFPTSNDYYGRFDIAYQDALYQWLSPSQKTVFRFYSPTNGTHFFTMNSYERDVVLTYPTFSYEGAGFMASPTPEVGLFNVYRFYNTVSQSHFYTIDEGEKNAVRDFFTTYNYEGTAWYARKTAANGWQPLYRFYRPSKSSHFYTANEGEKAFIIANQSSVFQYEGIAYYVKPIP